MVQILAWGPRAIQIWSAQPLKFGRGLESLGTARVRERRFGVSEVRRLGGMCLSSILLGYGQAQSVRMYPDGGAKVLSSA
jgi:hypothetical protein